ncbi:MAG: hypothetical protein ACFBSC_21990 [Microcoleaceae cyanobacterium]
MKQFPGLFLILTALVLTVSCRSATNVSNSEVDASVDSSEVNNIEASSPNTSSGDMTDPMDEPDLKMPRTEEAATSSTEAVPPGLTAEQVALSQRVQAQVLQGERQQNSQDLDQLYKDAAVADVELQQVATELADMTNGKVILPPGGLKGRERAEEKINLEYDGDASRITDLARLSLEYISLEELYQALEAVPEKVTIVHFKDRFIKPTVGNYRDILLNVKLSNGHVAEMQLTLDEINKARFGEGYKIYQEVRGIQAKAVMEDRPLTAEESQRVEELTRQAEVLYDEAYQTVLDR